LLISLHTREQEEGWSQPSCVHLLDPSAPRELGIKHIYSETTS
jgi:hypothetical protein